MLTYLILWYILLNNVNLPSSIIHMLNLYKAIIEKNETFKKSHYFCHYNSSVLKKHLGIHGISLVQPASK